MTCALIENIFYLSVFNLIIQVDDDFIETEEVEESLEYDAHSTVVSPDWQGVLFYV